MVMWELTTGRKPFFNIERRPFWSWILAWAIMGRLDFGLSYEGMLSRPGFWLGF
ncbi:hypothetical protein C1646_820310 [Rhizophagus diaphanus]|nr:hypothetical protein C1646_820310 [Rhizophagus diaphanus] [Rhizophagus sp. MUCL 43196]